MRAYKANNVVVSFTRSYQTGIEGFIKGLEYHVTVYDYIIISHDTTPLLEPTLFSS